jgi:NADPH:quinone reductase
MRALRFEQTGSLDQLHLSDLEMPRAGPGEIVVEVHAASVNRSDLKNVLGRLPQTSVPRTAGRDFAGIVVDGPLHLRGIEVFGLGGGLGFWRDGTHAERVLLPQDGIVRKPAGLSMSSAASMCLSYVTAYYSLLEIGGLSKGVAVLVTGVNGSVGSAAAAIAAHRRAKVIGIARHRPETGFLHRFISLEDPDWPKLVRDATGSNGVALALDTIGGPIFGKVTQTLAHRGRLVAIASTETPTVSFDLVEFYHREASIRGADTLSLSIQACAAMLRELVPQFADGTFPPPPIEEFPLDDAKEVYRRLERSELRSKPILVPNGHMSRV